VGAQVERHSQSLANCFKKRSIQLSFWLRQKRALLRIN
jgi:hypothetical protein